MEVDADFTRSQRASSQIDLELTDLEVALESKGELKMPFIGPPSARHLCLLLG